MYCECKTTGISTMYMRQYCRGIVSKNQCFHAQQTTTKKCVIRSTHTTTNSISIQQHCRCSNSRIANQKNSRRRNTSLADTDAPHSGKVDGREGKEEEEVVQRLWGMPYADDVGIVW